MLATIIFSNMSDIISLSIKFNETSKICNSTEMVSSC